jgi:dihydrofolate reductase
LVEEDMSEKNPRRLVQSVLVSINGVTGRPLAWAGPYFGPGMAAQSLTALRSSDAMLMGRGTYDVFSRQWPGTSGEYADHLNAMPKYVFSSTLESADWENTTVVDGDVAEEVAALKRTGGKDLVVYGHGRFGQTLVDAGLVDELTLTVVPVFATGDTFHQPGGGAHSWRLTSAGPGLDEGLARLTYEPVR